jgi:hypothetical protein
MPAQWKSATASEVRPRDQIRLASGRSLTVTRIESALMGRPGLIAFVQDTSEWWFKQPMPSSTTLDVLHSD